MVLAPGCFIQASPALEGIGGILGNARIALGLGSPDMLRRKVKVFDDMSDDYVTGIPVLVHFVKLVILETVIEPRHAAVFEELVKIEIRPEPAGEAFIMVFVSLRHGADVAVEAVDKIVDRTEVAPAPGC